MRHRAYIHTIDIKFLYIEYSYMRLLIDRTIMRVVIMNVYTLLSYKLQLGDSNIYYYYTVYSIHICMHIHVYLYVC